MENIEAMLCAYIEGDLDEAGRAQIEKHLAGNPQHRKLLEELTAMRDYVRQLPRARAPRDIADSMRGTMERSLLLDGAAAGAGGIGSASTGRPSRWPRLFAVAAVFFLIASMGILVLHMLSPTLNAPNWAVNKSSSATQPIGPVALANPTTEPSDDMPVLAPSTRRAPAMAPPSLDADSGAVANKELARQTIAVAGGGVWDKDRAQLGPSGNQQTSQAIDLAGAPVVLVVRGPDPVAVSQNVQRYLQSHPELAWSNPRATRELAKAQVQAQTQPAATEPSTTPAAPTMFHVRNLNPQQLADLQAAMTAINDNTPIPVASAGDSLTAAIPGAVPDQDKSVEVGGQAEAQNNNNTGSTTAGNSTITGGGGGTVGNSTVTAGSTAGNTLTTSGAQLPTTPASPATTRFDAAATQPAATQPSLVDAYIIIGPTFPTTNPATTQPDVPARQP